jgi:hypothetical protein
MGEPLSTLIRRAILESGQSRYAISVACGVPQSALSRFMAGKSSLNLDTTDKLVAGLGIKVKLPNKTKAK